MRRLGFRSSKSRPIAVFVSFVALLVSSSSATVQAKNTIPSYVAYIVKHCGVAAYTTMRSDGLKLFADSDSSDSGATVSDARDLIRIADDCKYKLPECDSSDSACSGAAVVLDTDLLMAERQLSGALYKTEPNSIYGTFNTALLQAVALCNSPHITDAGEPYYAARLELRQVLEFAATAHRETVGSPVDAHLVDLQACSYKITPDIQW